MMIGRVVEEGAQLYWFADPFYFPDYVDFENAKGYHANTFSAVWKVCGNLHGTGNRTVGSV